MKSVSRAGVKLWAPPSIVKFGCLVHDVQLSSRARRICRMVSESSIQIVMFASPVSLRMVFLMFWSICMRVERRRWPQTQTSSLPVMFQSVSLLPQALPASLSLSVPVTEPQIGSLRLSLGRQYFWWIGEACRVFVNHAIVFLAQACLVRSCRHSAKLAGTAQRGTR